ncbi:hypothetical protein [Rhizobium sp. LC145]|jgi:hypothetical protein|uniref:hypothetical protein n=1 Tax=Rhizobium sp. LC145 TaxID=1120688 RepID=UPI000AABF4DE|nr:hypothetical protein [Rhizobium sp. LC145]
MPVQNYNVRGGFLGRAIAVFGAAVSVSAAVEGRRTPKRHDLETLGIDPKAFAKIG